MSQCPQATIFLFLYLCSPFTLYAQWLVTYGPRHFPPQEMSLALPLTFKLCLLSLRLSHPAPKPLAPFLLPPSNLQLFLPITALTPPPLGLQPDFCTDSAPPRNPYHQMQTSRRETVLDHHGTGLRLVPGGSAAFLVPRRDGRRKILVLLE